MDFPTKLFGVSNSSKNKLVAEYRFEKCIVELDEFGSNGNVCRINCCFANGDSLSTHINLSNYKDSVEFEEVIEQKIIYSISNMSEEIDFIDDGKHLLQQYPELKLPNKINDFVRLDWKEVANLIHITPERLNKAIADNTNILADAFYRFAENIYCFVYISKAYINKYDEFVIYVSFMGFDVKDDKLCIKPLFIDNLSSLNFNYDIGKNKPYNEQKLVQFIIDKYNSYCEYIEKMHNQIAKIV